jgi:hypothetical protein
MQDNFPRPRSTIRLRVPDSAQEERAGVEGRILVIVSLANTTVADGKSYSAPADMPATDQSAIVNASGAVFTDSPGYQAWDLQQTEQDKTK